MQFGEEILRQADVLGAITEEPGRITRTYLTPQHREAGERILGWMREAGMDAGRFDFSALDRQDTNGVTMREALVAFGGGPAAIGTLKRDRIAAYVESHIEQGPVLLNEGLAVGVVTSIAGGTRVRARVEGLAGHAGTVPMPVRRDALAAASEMVLAIERHCAARAESLVGTVGKLAVAGGGRSTSFQAPSSSPSICVPATTPSARRRSRASRGNAGRSRRVDVSSSAGSRSSNCPPRHAIRGCRRNGRAASRRSA